MEITELFSLEIMEEARKNILEGRTIPVYSDVGFKLFFASESENAVFCRNNFLSSLTGENIVESMVLNTEILPEFLGGKVPRVDLYCKTDEGIVIDVEIQMSRENDDQMVRSIYYGSKLFSGAGKKGRLFKNIPKVYQIMLSDFNIFNDKDYAHHLFFKDQHNEIATKRLELVFIEFPKLQRLLENKGGSYAEILDSLQDDAFWAILIRNSNNCDFMKSISSAKRRTEIIEKAGANMIEVSKDEIEWAYHLSYDRAEIDYKNGMEISREEGLAEGIAQGSRNKAVETARNMLSKNISVEIVVECTGLSVEEVEKLSENLKKS